MLVKCKFKNKNNFEIIDFTEELLNEMSQTVDFYSEEIKKQIEKGEYKEINKSITFFYKKNKFYDYDNEARDYVCKRNYVRYYKGGGWARPFQVVYRCSDGDCYCDFREMIRNIEDEDFDYILFD
ncbi:hypothetical protein [Clostridium sporogenes]|uniref:hypothetical protein n=1 Tax=Clostridium sporogenes TaxID=1509 RepID=UPI0006B2A5EA|nr:hypothetical protein [Clostridium sporogenes]KOY65436.1 hypothetical protein AN649_13245 [Clostridium sporogenes]MDS1006628.1 hypothetical protein [Clostridium sporogenes]